MKSVSTLELRNNLSSYLHMVTNTDTQLVIKKFGKPIALITPLGKKAPLDFSTYFGFLGKGEDGTTFLKKIRRTAKEKDYLKTLKRHG